MNEEQWLSCTDPIVMVEFLRGNPTSEDTVMCWPSKWQFDEAGKGTDRKFRLFACACCRRIWDRLPDPCNRSLVAAVEDYPDGKFDDSCPELQDAIYASSAREEEFSREPAYWVAKVLGRGFYKMTAARSAVVVVRQVARLVEHEHEREAEAGRQVALLRDIFGNPFGPLPPIEPSLLTWNGGLIRALAQAAYDDRLLPSGELDPVRLAVLADALEDAGCDNDDVLSHLRQQGMFHVRGCHVVDLLLNKG
jgi:hypothetical protein